MRAMGISIHTGWGACVVVGGSPRAPEIIANEIVHLLGEDDRFCFHAAAEMSRSKAPAWIVRTREKALKNAKRALTPALMRGVKVCALVAKDGAVADLDRVLAS